MVTPRPSIASNIPSKSLRCIGNSLSSAWRRPSGQAQHRIAVQLGIPRPVEGQQLRLAGIVPPAVPHLIFDRAGDAELYGNTVLGLACRYYDFDRFRPLLNEFLRSAQEALYTYIFLLVLEGAMFARGAADRPLLPALRRDYARRLLAQTPVAEGMNPVSYTHLDVYKRQAQDNIDEVIKIIRSSFCKFSSEITGISLSLIHI